MKRLVLLALCILALPLSAIETITTDPEVPKAGSTVTVLIPNVCAGAIPGVDRRGFDILISIGDCSLADPPLFETMQIVFGPLPPGKYHVTVQSNDEFEPIYARGVFTVVDDRPFHVHPDALPANSAIPYEIAIELTPETDAACREANNCVVRVDGQIPAQREQNRILYVQLPAHGAGLVNVSVGFVNSPSALYFYDTTRAPDTAYFERVLIPILFNTKGLDSDWRSEAVVKNLRPWTIETFDGKRFAPSAKETLGATQWPHGHAFVTPRSDSGNLALALRVRDVSRAAEGLGTQIPVVREADMFRTTVNLNNIPIDPRYRVKVRVYAFDVPLGGSVSAAELPAPVAFEHDCHDVRSCAATPAFAEFNFPTGGQGQWADVLIELPEFALGWAFATVTNNDTQQVTIVTPDGYRDAPDWIICAIE